MEEEIGYAEMAIRSSPRDPNNFFHYSDIAAGHFAAGRNGAAIDNAQRAIRRKPGHFEGYVAAAAAHALSGDIETARRVAQRASGSFGRPAGFPDGPFRKAMGFTSSHGVSGARLRTRALQGSARIGTFQVVGDKSFFRQLSVYEALEKQARNKRVSSRYQAPDGGFDGLSPPQTKW
jgi:tetratricopeptide (TPR) repeat protein